MENAAKERAIRQQLIPALEANPRLNKERMDDMVRAGSAALSLYLRPGHGPTSGWGFRRSDIEKLIAEFEQRPGFSTFSAADHVEASPMERLRRANRDAARRQ